AAHHVLARIAADQAMARPATASRAPHKSAQAIQAPMRLCGARTAPRFARQGRQWFTPSQVVAHSWQTTLRHDMHRANPRRPGWWAQLWTREVSTGRGSLAQDPAFGSTHTGESVRRACGDKLLLLSPGVLRWNRATGTTSSA